MNPYKLLGLKDNASIEETKKRFRKLSLKLHPDKGGDEEVYAKLLEAYHLILDGYKVEVPVYKPKPKPNNQVTYIDVFLTLEEGFNGCKRNVYHKDGNLVIDIPQGVLPDQTLIYDGYGETNSDGVRGKLSVDIKFIMPEGFTFERYLSETVLVYSVKFKNRAVDFTVTVNNKSKKIKMPSKVYDGMFLKVKNFGYVNGGTKHPLYVRIGLK